MTSSADCYDKYSDTFNYLCQGGFVLLNGWFTQKTTERIQETWVEDGTLARTDPINFCRISPKRDGSRISLTLRDWAWTFLLTSQGVMHDVHEKYQPSFWWLVSVNEYSLVGTKKAVGLGGGMHSTEYHSVSDLNRLNAHWDRL